MATIFVAQNATAVDIVLTDTNAIELGSESLDYDIYSTFSSGNPKIGVADGTYDVGSITLKAAGLQVPGEPEGTLSTNPADVMLYGKYNFDINRSEGEKVILDNQSVKRFNFQSGATVTISNSATPTTDKNATAPLAVIKLGSGDGTARSLMMQKNVNITFKTNARIDSNSLQSVTWYPVYIYGNGAKLSVENGSTLTVNSNTRLGDSNSTPTISVTDGSTICFRDLNNQKELHTGILYAYSGNIIVDETSKFQIKKSSTFGIDEKDVTNNTVSLVATIKGVFDMDSSAEIKRTASFVVKNFEHAYGSQLKVSGSFEVQTDTKFANTLIQNKGIVKQSAGTTTNIERPFIVENGGTFSTAAGKLELKSGNYIENKGRWAYIQVDDGGTFNIDGDDARIVMGTGELILNKANAITKSDGSLIRIVTKTDSEKNEIKINASKEFKALYVNGSNIDYYFGESDSITLTSAFATTNAKHIFHNFDENRVFVVNAYNYDTLDSINSAFEAYQTIDGEEVKISQLYINNGWLSAIAPAVPEPAEWAMIFGAIALGLAVYRKRK